MHTWASCEPTSPTLNKCAPAAVALTQMSKQKALSERILTASADRETLSFFPRFINFALFEL